MTSSHRRFGFSLLLLCLASILPATVGAQPPVYLTQWGTQGNGNGEFNSALRVAVDAVGNVYVVDWARASQGGNSRIQKFTGSGIYLTQWGSFGNGNEQFEYPYGVAVDAAGDIFVADYDNFRIQKFGQGSTATKSMSWGRIRTLYR